MAESGHISIHTENILPIIKKWLYSEKEIFLREMVANATDAITKLEKLALIGEAAQAPEPRIDIAIDKDAKTLTITDTGLGLTADEMKKYINQVAFSGVKDFLDKYQGKDDEAQVIGHFGLGFYSAFMVANKVEIDSLSYQSGAKAAHWSCDGSTEFHLADSNRTAVGTTITLHISDDSVEVLDAYKLREMLDKYCAFIKVPIYLHGELVNDPRPLWTRSPSELEDKDYVEFYHKLFGSGKDPLFWIHLNVDYPFKLRGVLYFPQLKHELDAAQGEVKLYCNQVYVADNPKELIPDFLALLKGVVDCADLPLNVSRSYLQNDPQARKIREHIVKKVADRLSGMAKNERETYVKFWDDIHPFVKFGMMRDNKFYDRMKEFLIFKTAKNEYLTIEEYLTRYGKQTEDSILYASDEARQSSLLKLLIENDVDAMIASAMIDQHFLPFLEMQNPGKWKFKRVDSDILTHLKDHQSTSQLVDPADNKTVDEKLLALFEKHLTDKKVKVRIEALKAENVPAMLLADENKRRLKEMASSGMYASLLKDVEVEETLVVNRNSSAVKNLLAQTKKIAPNNDHIHMLVEHIFDLAYMQHHQFSPEGMQAFINRTATLLSGFGPTVDSSATV